MSTAHRPTWDPAQARDVKGGSRQFSARDMAAHTKLKFRQIGQTSTDEVKKRDLRAELLLAEQEARNKKRKAEGKPPLPIEGTPAEADDETNKRRKLLEEAMAMDKDDDDEEEEEEEEEKKGQKEEDDEDSDEEDSEEEDDEDETAELLRELEKIKRERAEEKARQEQQESATSAAAREAEIATGNPLLNLAAALGQDAPGLSTNVPGTFSVKRRWDDDLIFKNQAMNTRDKDKGGQFVNDLLRTEFHKFVLSQPV
ncbi:hypothetical protein H0H92_003364 [Tricholoma furcatifolium]|nr:hypothetical protein H0H92_003364 [Tricholoma furcatifolium]